MNAAQKYFQNFSSKGQGNNTNKRKKDENENKPEELNSAQKYFQNFENSTNVVPKSKTLPFDYLLAEDKAAGNSTQRDLFEAQSTTPTPSARPNKAKRLENYDMTLQDKLAGNWWQNLPKEQIAYSSLNDNEKSFIENEVEKAMRSDPNAGYYTTTEQVDEARATKRKQIYEQYNITDEETPGTDPTAPKTYDSLSRAEKKAIEKQVDAEMRNDPNAGYYTTTEQVDSAREETRRKILAEQGIDLPEKVERTPEEKKEYRRQILKSLEGAFNMGGDTFFSSATGFLDSALGAPTQELMYMVGFSGDSVNPFTALNNYVQKKQKEHQTYYNAQIGDNRLAQNIANYGAQVVNALPATLLAYATAGQSAMASTASLMSTAYANSLPAAEKFVYELGDDVVRMCQNPQWLSSFIQEAGSTYNENIANGMDAERAALDSYLYGVFAATIEVGGINEMAGGTQAFIKELQKEAPKTLKKRIGEYARSIGGEIVEENLQGMFQRGIQSFFGVDTKIASKGGDGNAIIDWSQMGEEAKGAAIISMIMGGGSAAVKGISSINFKSIGNTQVQDGKVVSKRTGETLEIGSEAWKADVMSDPQIADAISKSGENADTVLEAIAEKQAQATQSAQPTQTEITPTNVNSNQGAITPTDALVDAVQNNPSNLPDNGRETSTQVFTPLNGETVVKPTENAPQMTNAEQQTVPQTAPVRNPLADTATQTQQNSNQQEIARLESELATLNKQKAYAESQGNADMVDMLVDEIADKEDAIRSLRFNQPVSNALADTAQNVQPTRTRTPEVINDEIQELRNRMSENNQKYRDAPAEERGLISTENAQLQSLLNSLSAELYTATNGHPENVSSRTAIDNYNAPQTSAQPVSTQTDVNNGITPNGVNSQITSDNVNTQTAPTTPTQTNTNTPSAPNYVPTQDRFGERTFTEQEQRDIGINDPMHERHSDAWVDSQARSAIDADAVGERTRLLNTPTWSDVDTAESHILLTEDAKALREASAKGDTQAIAEISKRIAELKNHSRQQATEGAQALRQRNRNIEPMSGNTIIEEAAEHLFSQDDTISASVRLDEAGRGELMQTVTELVNNYDALQDGDIQSVKDLIRETAKIRKTTNIFTNDLSRKVSSAIDNVAKLSTANGDAVNGYDALKAILGEQIRSVSTDYDKVSIRDRLTTDRFLSMLSNLATTTRNISNNVGYGDVIRVVGNNIGVPTDILLSKLSGNKRTVGFERAVSKRKINASKAASDLAFIESNLDVRLSDEKGKYDGKKTRTHKAALGGVSRYFSTLEKYSDYCLYVPDEKAKARARVGVEDSLARVNNTDADFVQEQANLEAEERTFQDENKFQKKMLDARKILDEVTFPKTEFELRLGTTINPFARVGANVTKTTLELHPSSVWTSGFQLVKAMVDAKNGNLTQAQQRAVSKSIGQTAVGGTMVLLSTFLSAAGAISYTDDDDKDANALYKSMGKKGLQLNLDGALRALTNNGDGGEYQDGDTLISLGWMPQLNMLMAMGHFIAQDEQYADKSMWGKAFASVNPLNTFKNLGSSAQAAAIAIEELPLYSSLSSIVSGWKYADMPESENGDKISLGEELVARGKSVGEQVASDFLSSYIPNWLKGVAKGIDSKERNFYTSDSAVGEFTDSVKGSIPFLRNTLPEATDNFGHPIKKENGVLNFLNSTLLPGNINTFKSDDVRELVTQNYEATGNTSVIPNRNPPTSLSINGKDFSLDTAEGDTYQRTAGDTAEEMISEAIDTGLFEGMSDDEIAGALSEINNYARAFAKREFARENGIDKVNNDAYAKYDELDSPVQGLVIDKTWSTVTSENNRNYTAIDALLGDIDSYPEDVQEMVRSRDYVKRLETAAEQGVNAEDFFGIVDMGKAIKSGEADYTAVDALLDSGVFDDVDREALDDFTGYSHFDDLLAAKEMGLDAETVLTALNKYSEIKNSNPDMPADILDATYSNYVDGLGLSKEQSDMLKGYSSAGYFVKVDVTHYDKAVASGYDPDEALKAVNWVEENIPEGDANDVCIGILTDYPDKTTDEKIELVLATGYKPKMGDIAYWLSQNCSSTEISKYWGMFKEKYGEDGTKWKTSYEHNLKSYLKDHPEASSTPKTITDQDKVDELLAWADEQMKKNRK